ncbi:hypothetical protein FQA39_LY06322 [Lamprigera yunnana]|nr:hypothetical protein FQA39_LY06322 [Lamprigera yunnana]
MKYLQGNTEESIGKDTQEKENNKHTKMTSWWTEDIRRIVKERKITWKRYNQTKEMEVPLYVRESWVKLTQPILNACICESGADPTQAYRSLMFTELSNKPCLKRFYNCLQIKLNLIDASTGQFIEKEMLRQVEGATPAIYKKCEEVTKHEVDLYEKSFNLYMCLIHEIQKPVASHAPEKY